MKFHELIREGDYKTEKIKSQFHVYTKEDYLRRKFTT